MKLCVLGLACVVAAAMAFSGVPARGQAPQRIGQAIEVDLSKARPGPIATIPLGDRSPGKYIATVRVKLNPVDSFADGFGVSAGNGARMFRGTENPDPVNPDFRMWQVPFIYDGKGNLELKITLNRVNGMADRPAKQLFIDRVELAAVGASYIESVRPNKVCYDPNEEIACDVVVHGGNERMVVRAMEYSGIADQREAAKAPLPANGKLTLRWNAGEQQYGREVRIELVQDNKTIDSAGDVYNVTDNVWKVAMAATVAGMHMSDPRSVYCSAKTDDQLAQNINVGTRGTYGNFVEAFAWAPDDAFDMTPAQEFWISGQACYQHQKSRLILMNKLLLANGIWPITYAKSAASGPPAFEFMRKHPELALTLYQSQFDEEYVEKWDRQIPGQEKTIFYTWMSCVLNIMKPEVVELAINEILNSSKMFGWRGARYDDHYTEWGRPDSATSTGNMQRIFDGGKQSPPGFVWGFNYLTSATPFGWPRGRSPGRAWKDTGAGQGAVPDPVDPGKPGKEGVYPEFIMACQNGGLIMNEEARGACQKNGPYPASGTYTNYAELLTHEARLTRGLGGHYGVIPFDTGAKTTFDGIFPDILRLTSRAHSYGQIAGGAAMLRFVTRYSAFLYGTDLEAITDPESTLHVDAPAALWWHNYCYQYKHGEESAVVVHLLAGPRNDHIFENKDGEISRVHGVAVTYAGPGKVTRAWELSPFIEGFRRELPVKDNTVKPSDFYLWSMVILETGK